MTQKNLHPAFRLAVSYHAYMVAVNEADRNGIVVWGEMLLDDQAALEIELVDIRQTNRIINRNKDQLREDREKITA